MKQIQMIALFITFGLPVKQRGSDRRSITQRDVIFNSQNSLQEVTGLPGDENSMSPESTENTPNADTSDPILPAYIMIDDALVVYRKQK